MKVLVTTKSQFSLSKDETRRFIATLAIKFSDTSINTFEVIHRYQINDRSRSNEYSGVNEAVKSLAGFLAYKLSGTVVVE